MCCAVGAGDLQEAPSTTASPLDPLSPLQERPPSLGPHQNNALVRPSKIDDKENRSCPKMLTRKDARFSQSQTSRIEAPSPFEARDASAPQQPMLRAPNGAPNVVIVLIDDIGFGTQASLEAVSTCPPRIVWRKPGCATRARNNFY
jgi:hypothetical protein